MSPGMHPSPYHGFSVEFAEHREYVPGDDIRHVDWKVWSKTDKLYLKQYEQETNLLTYLLLDTSESMAYASGGNVTKLRYAQFIAASLAYLILAAARFGRAGGLRRRGAPLFEAGRPDVAAQGDLASPGRDAGPREVGSGAGLQRPGRAIQEARGRGRPVRPV